MKLSHILNAILPPLSWAGLIFFLSSQPVLPGIEIVTLDFAIKKIGHMTVYGVLYMLIYRATSILTKSNTHREKWLLYFPFLICILYAISDEIHQSFVPNRFGTVRDVGYDILGTTIAFLKVYKYI